MPYECRDLVTGNEFGAGCRQALAWWLEPWTSTLASLCIFLVVADAVGIAATQTYKRYIRRWKEAEPVDGSGM